MIPFWVEAIYGIAQLLTFYRVYLQYVDSKKERRSVNSKYFWILSIMINLLVAIYGFLIGSFIMPLAVLLSLPIALWHFKLEKERDDFNGRLFG